MVISDQSNASVERGWDTLIEKYDSTGPRYTSYPTALQFGDDFSPARMISAIKALPDHRNISLYLHIPFCQNICFYCACNKVVTKNKSRSDEYLCYLIKELRMYAGLVGEHQVHQIHLGGGTPNYLTTEQIDELMTEVHRLFNVTHADELDMSIEIDPRYVDDTYLEELRATGFNRLSFGVQDLNPKVQKAVNRVCSQEHIEYLLQSAREFGYASIHMDLIYGLPHQTAESFNATIKQIARMQPDRLSIFNYAHLPHRFPPQRRIRQEDLPSPREKLKMLCDSIDYLVGREYRYIGMDHFALDDSPLVALQNNRTLHRNFQGYTTHGECALIAVGVSAISQTDSDYSQNHRSLEDYYKSLDKDELPIWRGYTMKLDDQIRRALIMQLICHDELDIKSFEEDWNIEFTEYFADEYASLLLQQEEGLLHITRDYLKISPIGVILVRNICMVFDSYINKFLPDNNHSRLI